MSSAYGFIKELIEKEKTPTPAYVFDLDRMKEFVEKVHSCLGEKAELCYAMKANPFLTGPRHVYVCTRCFSDRSHDGCGSFFRGVFTWRIQDL